MKAATLIVKIAVSLGLLAYILSSLDLADMLERTTGSDLAILALGVAVVALQPLLGALRWKVLLRALRQPSRFAALTRWTYVGLFLGQVLPTSVGADAVRIVFARRGGCSLKNAVNSVLLDRIALLLALVLMLAVSLPWIGQYVGAEELYYLVPLLLVGAVGGLVLLAQADRLPQRFQRGRAMHAASHLARDLRATLLDPAYGGATLLLTFASHLNLIAAIYVFARAAGATVGLGECLVLMPSVLLASVLPISIGGWGTREFAMVAALGTAGVSPEIAVLVSVWLGLASILVTTPGALALAFGGRRSGAALPPLFGNTVPAGGLS
ncbi:flippase-like domain-containing protein [Aurantimonas sp. MSK8Z-1]|uniref:lysylphosphatidylglycerol synthase transmembrane domain-containing protein n=1 Tax=Mangrovibrevibacter kandeliae TaxID=2968473 RepID=UPI0021178441|nr:lysylphosphatidylglycerol synthase transmembrane domain-containing protein [Aurantimonas sp. MSK8Z-1]MCW4116989.1 flippase-like domain-containing protein [Aurantimonas sp. MSK8Z-1]